VKVRLWQPLTHEKLLTLLATQNDRFEVASGKVRARYGHSLQHVTVGTPRRPPTILFHGTSRDCLDPIRVHGLRPGGRTAVHLTSDVRYSRLVAEDCDCPVVLMVLAAEAAIHSICFRQATEHVWLAHFVPAQFIALDEPRDRIVLSPFPLQQRNES
jgi:putative RNA 2'-phosphotransferase